MNGLKPIVAIFMFMVAHTVLAQTKKQHQFEQKGKVASVHVKKGKAGCTIGNYKIDCIYDSIRVELTPSQLDARNVFQVRLNNKWTTIYLDKKLQFAESVRLYEPEQWHSYTAITMYKNLVVFNNYEGLGPEQTKPYTKILDDGTRVDSVVLDEDGVVLEVYPPRKASTSASGIYDIKTQKWLLKQEYTSIKKVDNIFVATKINQPTANDSLYTITAVDAKGDILLKEVSLRKLAVNVEHMKTITGFKTIKAVEPSNDMTYTTYFVAYPVKITLANGTEKMYDLVSLKWLESN